MRKQRKKKVDTPYQITAPPKGYEIVKNGSIKQGDLVFLFSWELALGCIGRDVNGILYEGAIARQAGEKHEPIQEAPKRIQGRRKRKNKTW